MILNTSQEAPGEAPLLLALFAVGSPGPASGPFRDRRTRCILLSHPLCPSLSPASSYCALFDFCPIIRKVFYVLHPV